MTVRDAVSPRVIVVVGAALAGLRAVETLRAAGFDGRLVLIGAEEHLPYDRPPLSKELLAGTCEPERIRLREAASYAALDVELLLGTTAAALDIRERTVTVNGSRRIRYDGLVIATGTRPRTLPFGAYPAGVHTLRTLDDCLAIRRALDADPRVVVVGAGFIGAEVAATCRQRGHAVVLVEPLPGPLFRVLGAEVSGALAALHADHGVDLRLGTGVVGLRGSDHVEEVVLSDGHTVPADLVVVGVGVTPATEWLTGSGLALDDGVLCDATCATAAPNVVAAGDVARWYHPLLGGYLRVEHWTNATEQGEAAALRLLHGEAAAPYAPVPYVWSDQYEVKIQVSGWPAAGDEVAVVHGALAERRFVVLYGRAGRLVGAVAFNQPRLLLSYERLIAERRPFHEVVGAAGGPSRPRRPAATFDLGGGVP
jgi:3-phenylpropionate/trans-cinnamate dioxygenase ferredoxin reductase subunit